MVFATTFLKKCDIVVVNETALQGEDRGRPQCCKKKLKNSCGALRSSL